MTEAIDWSGPTGDVWASEWRRTDRSFGGLARVLNATVAAAAPAGRGRAVDIGCGAGATSLALAEARADLWITGIDLSADLIEIARDRAADGHTLSFIVGDAVDEAARLAPVDLFFSRHGVMFFDDPVAALRAFRQAAAPGGRLVFSCFRAIEENPWAREIALAVDAAAPPSGGDEPGPFAFADPDRVARLLRDAGWRDPQPEPVDYAYRAGEGADPVGDAVAFFRRIGPAARALRALPPEAHAAAIARLTDVVAHHRIGDAIDFPAAAWIWSTRAD